MTLAGATAREARTLSASTTDNSASLLDFETLYDRYAEFVWRNARRLGIPDAGLDDAVQDVFLVAHRKLGELLQSDSLRAWIFSILIRVVRAHKRTLRRKDPQHRSGSALLDPDELPDTRTRTPSTEAEQADTVRLLHRALGELDDAKREVLVLAELEELTEPEIALVLGEKVNTVHSRLRAARKDFDRAVLRQRVKDEWRLR